MIVEIAKSNQIICKSGEPIADVTLTTPIFSESKAAKRLTKYYTKVEATILELLQKLPSPLNVPMEIRFNVTQNDGIILSLYRDIYIGSNFTRIADTWKNGYPISLKNLGLKSSEIIKTCINEAEILERSGYISLFPNYHKIIQKKCRPECFYIQDGYPVIFFQPGILTGKNHGVIKFKCDLLFESKL